MEPHAKPGDARRVPPAVPVILDSVLGTRGQRGRPRLQRRRTTTAILPLPARLLKSLPLSLSTSSSAYHFSTRLRVFMEVEDLRQWLPARTSGHTRFEKTLE